MFPLTKLGWLEISTAVGRDCLKVALEGDTNCMWSGNFSKWKEKSQG